MSYTKINWREKCAELEAFLEQEKVKVQYYQNIAQVEGKKSLREISKLSQIITERIRAQRALRESEENFRALAENANDGILIATGEGIHVYANKRATEITDHDDDGLLKTGLKGAVDPGEFRDINARHKRILKERRVPTSYETSIIRENGQRVPVEITDAKTTWQGQPAIISILRDITERKERERVLREKDKELEIKATSLEEVNTALRVLLKKRDEDKGELEEKVLCNVRGLVFPHLNKLKKSSLDANQTSCVAVIESNLSDIISPFARKLSSKYLGLTPTEIRVANLVKDGNSTKELAEFMTLSPRTIECHRGNIRKKLGIKKKKANLRTYLSSIQ
jgi:PAS domain S-box-containing protein